LNDRFCYSDFFMTFASVARHPHHHRHSHTRRALG
jgi:hypothetical protein